MNGINSQNARLNLVIAKSYISPLFFGITPSWGFTLH